MRVKRVGLRARYLSQHKHLATSCVALMRRWRKGTVRAGTLRICRSDRGGVAGHVTVRGHFLAIGCYAVTNTENIIGRPRWRFTIPGPSRGRTFQANPLLYLLPRHISLATGTANDICSFFPNERALEAGHKSIASITMTTFGGFSVGRGRVSGKQPTLARASSLASGHPARRPRHYSTQTLALSPGLAGKSLGITTRAVRC